MNKITMQILIMGTVLSVLNGVKELFRGSIPRGDTPSIPHGRGRRERHKIHVPNGKWMMKAHRGRR